MTVNSDQNLLMEKRTMSILIVDDNEGIAELLSDALTDDGHKCLISNHGKNALSLIECQKFDVILLDLAMPEFSGFDVIDALEKSGKLNQQKIIVLTALSSSPKFNKLKKQGIHAVLKKPVEMDFLLSTIES